MFLQPIASSSGAGVTLLLLKSEIKSELNVMKVLLLFVAISLIFLNCLNQIEAVLTNYLGC